MLLRCLHSEMAMAEMVKMDINLTMHNAAIDSTDGLKNPESEDKARKEANKLFESLAQYGTDDHSFSKDIFLS